MADLIPITQVSTDGWTKDTDTWTYVSATSFKVTGKNVTARFPVGAKFKLTQTTAKYFYVVSAAFSTDTTVTITGGSDYALANAAIDSPCYSYASSPQGFPHWFNYSETWTGFSTPPSGNICRFRIEGRTVFYAVARLTNGTSNAINCQVSLPVAATSATDYYTGGWAVGVDNGVASGTGYRYWIVASGTVAVFGKNDSATGWTTSGGKLAIATIIYEI